MVDTPGRFGGRLSDALLLRVEEIGGGSWTGPLAGPDALDLGVMEPGEGRSYRLTLTLPDTGPARPRQRRPGLVGDDRLGVGDRVRRAAARPRRPPTADRRRATPPPAAAARRPGARDRARGPAARARRAAAGAAHPAPARARHARDLVYGSCDRPCRITFRARIQTSPLARASARTLLRRRVFRALGAAAAAAEQGRAERRIRLRLTPRAVRTLKRTMHRRGRVAVVIEARVRGAGGARTVTRRIVLKRAERERASGGRRPER